MRHEIRIGWRYLYGGKRDRLMQLLALGGLIVMAIGILTLLASDGANPVGVLTLVLGMIAASAFFLFSVFSVFTSVSVLGVVFGVAALTVVLAVTTGFQKEFRDKVLGVNAHVIVLKSQDSFGEYREVMKIAHDLDRDILAVQPFIFRELLVTRGKGELSGAAIKGIDPTLASGVLDLDKHMIAPDRVDSLLTPPCPAAAGDRPAASGPDRPKCLAWPPIILGKGLAHKLKAKVGDVVTLVMPLSSFDLATWRSSPPQTRRFTVTGIFYSGFDEYDRRLMYASLADTQELVGAGDQVLGIELKVKDVERAADIARRLAKALVNPQYQVQDWYELNQNLFTALKVQKVVLVVILTLIIIVAAVNMVSALTMMVTDKTREIAILKSMGASSSSVALVFQVVGLVIGLAGTIVGVLIGLGTCYVVGRYGYHLDPRVYLIDRLPVEVRPLEVLLVAGITMAISVISTLAPSRSAASLRPVDGLRYD